MRFPARLALAPTALVATLGVTACDSSTDDPTTTTQTFSTYTVSATSAAFIDACSGGQTLSLNNNDESTSADGAVVVPWSVPFFDRSFTNMRVSTNGWLSFSSYLTDSAPRHENGVQTLPSEGAPNAAVYALWEDLKVRDTGSGICVATTGAAGSRTFVVEWQNVAFTTATALQGNLTFEVQLHEADGSIDIVYQSLEAGDGNESRMSQITVGIENEADLGSSHPGNAAVVPTTAPSTAAGFHFAGVE